jgi:Leucine-rich repeat (LRR) protein
LWPRFHQCQLYHFDLSESFQSQLHSFTGSTWQKSKTTAVRFRYSSKIDFIPKQIPEEFPNLNGFRFSYSNLPVFKNDLFSEEFVVLEYLDLWYNKIVSIEPFAFKNLKNLKWLRLVDNKIQSLPFNLFQKNPKLILLDFMYNQINSISPNLLKNLNQLKRVDFRRNQCVNKEFGCETCTPISQSELDSGLSTCFQNCLKDPDCAKKSELVEATTEAEKVRDPIQTTPQVTTTPPPKTEEDLPDSPAQKNARANNPNPTLQSLETNLTQELAISDLTTESSQEIETTETVTPNSAEIEEPESEAPSQISTAEPETELQDLKLVLAGIDEKLLNMTEDLRVALATKIESENEAIKSKIEETNKLSHAILEKLNEIIAGKINCGLENANELLTAQLENEKLKVKILKAELLQKKMEKELKNMKLQSKGNLKQ